MKKAVTAILAALLISYAALYCRKRYVDFCESMANVFVHDSAMVIAEEVHRLLHESPDPTEQQLRDCMVQLDRASVIHLWYDGQGGPVDRWGHPFRITFDRGVPESSVTCCSLGPDGKLGTDDDLSVTVE
jgi:hypothetical protein